MKKIILVFTAFTIALASVKAQTTKGNLFIGTGLGTTAYSFGTATYTYSDGNVKTDDQKNYSLDLSPEIGVFLSDHFVLGGMLDLSYNHNKDNVANSADGLLINNVTANTTTVSVGPFIRYYFFDANPGKNLFFIQAQAGLGSGSASSNTSTLDRSNTSTAATGNSNGVFVFKEGGMLGLTHFIEKNIGLDIGIGYMFDDQKYTTTINQTSTTVGVATNNPSTYKSSIPQSGIALSAGFHFFVK